MSEWDNIQGLDGWSAKLAELLKDAEAAAQTPDLGIRLALNARLTEFIVHSAPNTPDILQLDTLAAQAREGLMHLTIEERLAAISARTGDLARLTKEFQTRAAANVTAAASIRLERTRRVVVSLTEAIHVLKEFRNALETGPDNTLMQHIDRLVASIQELRNSVEVNV